MSLVTEARAREELAPYFGPILKSMDEGWVKWTKQDEEYKVDQTSTSRASCVHDFTVAKASKYLPEATVHNKSKLKIFDLDGRYALRFKKLNSRRRACNQPTKQVAEFKGQESIGDIRGLCHIEAGYLLNDMGSEIIGFNLLCPNGPKRFYWDIDLTSLESKGTLEIVSPDGGIITEDEQDKGLVFTPKKTDKIVPFKQKK